MIFIFYGAGVESMQTKWNEMFGEEKDDVVEENVKVKKSMKEGELCLNSTSKLDVDFYSYNRQEIANCPLVQLV
jgi:hypothetical protein